MYMLSRDKSFIDYTKQGTSLNPKYTNISKVSDDT